MLTALRQELNSDCVCSLDEGDSRANEQNVLAVLHTLWLREHNRIESVLHQVNPGWLGERLYQETRRIMSALMQHITYAEFLPSVLGSRVIDQYNLTLVDSAYYDGQLRQTDSR